MLLVACGLAFAAATWFGGWWAVPVLSLLLGAVTRRLSPPLVGTAAAIAWLAMILEADRGGSLWRLLDQLGGIFGAQGWMILILAGGFAFLLGWSGARLGGLLQVRPRPGNG